MADEIKVTFTGPDEDGNAWAHTDGPDGKRNENLGKFADVAEAMCQWLGSIDHLERG